jgi:dCMP deaminase
MPTQNQIDKTMLELAQTISRLSKDPRTKVGAILLSKCGKKLSMGYNGFPQGVEESSDLWQREIKHDYVQHAEINAIVNCEFEKEGATLYSTLQPCTTCLGAIINSGIKRVVYENEYKRIKLDVWNHLAKNLICDIVK